MPFGRRLRAAGACLVSGLICLSILGLFTPAGATTLRRMDLPEVVAAADRVVQARAVENRVYWNANHTQIFTDTVFEVISDVKGLGPKKLTITQLGGRIDPIDILVEGTPTFSVGEEVVLFTQADSNGSRQIVGLSQGVMRVQDDPETGRKVAVGGVPGGVTFVGGRPERSAVPLDTLIENVRELAAGGNRGSSLSKPAVKPEAPPAGGKP